MFDNLDIDCPDCGGRVRFSLDDLANERTKRCSRGHAVTLRDEGGGAAKANKALKDLDKSIARLGRNIRL